jgi:hypothetical protein
LPTETPTATPTQTPTGTTVLPSETPTQTPTGTPVLPSETPTQTPTQTPSNSVVYDYYDMENCCAPFDNIVIGVVQGVAVNQDAGVIYNGNSYVLINVTTAPAVAFYTSTVENICSTITCPTPTPTPTQTSTPLPVDCAWSGTTSLWENNTNEWDVCSNLPNPTPSATATSTPPPTGTPTNTPTPSSSPILANYLLFENSDIIETEQGDLLEPDL